MNVTQRKYTLDRLQSQLSTKVYAIIAENDAAVVQSNQQYTITFEDFEKALAMDSTVVKLVKTTGSSLQADYHINETAIRKLLNKPLVWLTNSNNSSYVSEQAKHLQQELIVLGSRKVLINSFAERINKLNTRAQYAKDQVMLGDAKEALVALEEFNSLIF